MQQALSLANEAFAQGEVPVGAVIVDSDGKIIGRGYNKREKSKMATAHAEIEAIEQACKEIDDWRLEGCTMFVTLEPCPMCTGAIINSRIPVVVYGAKDENMGCCSSVIDLFSENLGHKPAVYCGVMGDECRAILKKFFEELR